MISWRDIGRGIYRRFVPAVVATEFVLSLPTWVAAHVAPSLVASLTGLGALVLGYSTVLGLLRTRLRADAGVDGRRSVIAGIASLGLIVAAAATFRIGSPSILVSLSRFAGLYFGSSVLVTVGLYFPWIGAREANIANSDTLAELATPSSPIDDFAAASTSRDRDRVS